MVKTFGEDIIIDNDVLVKQEVNINGSHVAIDKGFYCTNSQDLLCHTYGV
jgi:hypothetical protein